METQKLLDDFLQKKGIDSARFAQAMPEWYARYLHILSASGVLGLDYAQKFQWNDLRLEFPKRNL